MAERLMDGIAKAVKEHAQIEIRISSPGGRVDAMLIIYDALRVADHAGSKSTCYVEPDGMAASAAAFIFEGCTTRVMAPSSKLLFHEVAAGGRGKKGDFRRTANDMEDMDARIAATIAWRLGMSAEEYMAWVSGRDRWIDAAGALKRHAVDRVSEK